MSRAFQRPNKRVKMLHRSTPYDYVVRSMLRLGKNVVGERSNILEGEILMTNPSSSGQYLSSHAHVHSDQEAFGLTSFDEACKQLQYSGIAVTGYNAKTSQYSQGFVATVGGINTIMNTGEKPITAGKLIYALPRHSSSKVPNIRGVPSGKKLFALCDDKGTSYVEAAKVSGVDVDKFCIGMALSNSRSGQTVDVLLHSRVSNS